MLSREEKVDFTRAFICKYSIFGDSPISKKMF